jgi:serine/threonine-protein kinase
MPLSQGQVIKERYRIAHLISQSNHGAIYRAWDLQNQDPCTLKEHLDPQLQELELFRNEANRLFTLNHPNLPKVFDFFALEGQGEYLAMEFIEGADLGSIQEDARQAGNARLQEADVLPWLMQVSDALVYLHSQAPPILHGDVKPENIRITPQGMVYLVDLGLSHLASQQMRASAAGREVTPGYSAPEQYGASPLDVRSDVYALGATLYRVLTGVTPPDGVDLMTGAASLAPARQLNPQISPETDRLIQQALQVNRNARLPDVRAFKNGLSGAYSRIVAPVPDFDATMATPVAVAATQVTPAGGPPVVGPPGTAPVAGEDGSKRRNTILIATIAGIAVLCGVIILLFFLYRARLPAPSPEDQVATQAAQTIEAQITLTAGLTATNDAIQTALATMFPGTPSPLPPTGTPPASPTPPPTQAVCTKASFVSDVTIPDNTVMNPNTPFTKIWRVRNDSNCTWTQNYAIVFGGGTLMSNQNSYPFPGQVAPGETVDLAVDMQSPSGPGNVQGNWLLRTPENVTFGVGGNNPLFVRIIVLPVVPPNPGFAYDFTANYCNATWRTGAGVIPCNSISSDPRGSVLALAEAPLERGQENEPGLWVRPDQNRNAFILGEYPNYTIQVNDHFLAEVGCAASSTGCEVRFVLDMDTGTGSVNLGVWNEVFDNRTQVVDIDLSGYAGQTVRFFLRMEAPSNPALANGIWFVPSIRNIPQQAVPPLQVLTPTP